MTVLRLLPSAGIKPQSLIVGLHGVGADALTLRPLGQMIQSENPTRAVIIPDAPHPSDLNANGRQWFSVRGVTDANRAKRIAFALPWLEAFIQIERRSMALDAKQVAVFGFSQGAMMALALASGDHAPRAIVSIAGRISAPVPEGSNNLTRIFLLHGDRDTVVPFACMGEAERTFRMAGYPVTLMPIDGLGHVISPLQADATCAFFAHSFRESTLAATV